MPVSVVMQIRLWRAGAWLLHTRAENMLAVWTNVLDWCVRRKGGEAVTVGVVGLPKFEMNEGANLPGGG
jgi:hypothetical protein